MSCLLQTSEVCFWIWALKRLGQCLTSFLAAEAVREPRLAAPSSSLAGRGSSAGGRWGPSVALGRGPWHSLLSEMHVDRWRLPEL